MSLLMAIRNTCTSRRLSTIRDFYEHLMCLVGATPWISEYIRGLCPIYITRDAWSTCRCCFCGRLLHPGRVMPAGGHLAAQITRAKRPRTTIYHPTARRGIPHTVSPCHFGLAALSRLSRLSPPFIRPSLRGKTRASTRSEINFSRHLWVYTEVVYSLQ